MQNEIRKYFNYSYCKLTMCACYCKEIKSKCNLQTTSLHDDKGHKGYITPTFYHPITSQNIYFFTHNMSCLHLKMYHITEVKWLFILILKGYVYTTKNQEYHSNLFYESVASSLALLEDTTAPLHSGMCTAPPQLPQTFIYALLETRGKNILPFKKKKKKKRKAQLLQYISPLGANCPCVLNSPAFSIPEDNWFEGPCFKSKAFTL